jgi:hypothetical protein
MIKEALQYLVGLNTPAVIDANGIKYSDKNLQFVTGPKISALPIRSLLGFTQLLSAKFEGVSEASGVIIHVESPTQVSLIGNISDAWGRRIEYIKADCKDETSRFPFGRFMEPEEFVISVQSMFVPAVGDTDYILNRCSSLASEVVALAADDGISQTATFKKGVVLKAEEVVRARPKLAPYRTFREVEQPVSEFLFRLKPREGQPPSCALFEADGGKWKLDAISNVAAWLSKNTTNVTVIS